MKMKARIRTVIEEEFDFDTGVVDHEQLPNDIEGFISLSRADQHAIHSKIAAHEDEVLETRVNAARYAEKLAQSMMEKNPEIVEVVVEGVSEA